MRRLATAARIRAFLARLGREAREPVTAYLVGGSTAVLIGWRDSSEGLSSFFADIEGDLYRFPAVDPASLRRAVEAAVASAPDES